jgi:hypothetical protein
VAWSPSGDQRVVVADDLLDLLNRRLAPEVHLEPGLFQNLHAARREVVADQNLHGTSVG